MAVWRRTGLDALLAGGVIPDLRPVQVDLGQLSDVLEGDPMNGNGRIEGSRDGYRDVEWFIGTVRDPGRADLLDIAITGREPGSPTSATTSA
jgi:hypothetical protein